MATPINMVNIDDRLATHPGMGRFGHDDGYAVSRPERSDLELELKHVFLAIVAFATDVEARCDLLLVPASPWCTAGGRAAWQLLTSFSRLCV